MCKNSVARVRVFNLVLLLCNSLRHVIDTQNINIIGISILENQSTKSTDGR